MLSNPTMNPEGPGPVIFAGAGPGAADLLTLRAARALEQADVVLYDALGCESALQYCRQARLIPIGKRAGGVSTEQSFINRRLICEASSGIRVVRLKGGDPAIFGRLDEEISALRSVNISFEIIPGITAASAAAAQAGVPLTKRGVARSVTITSPAVQRGAPESDDWLKQCDPTGTTAVYMAGRCLRKTARALIDRGYCKTTPVKIAHAVSTNAEQIIDSTLAVLAAAYASETNHSHQGPCLLLVGQAIGSACTAAIASGAMPSIRASVSG